MWNLKYRNKAIYKRETDSQTQRTDLWLSRWRGLGEGQTGSLRLADANYFINRMGKQQDSIVQHRELYSVSCDTS